VGREKLRENGDLLKSYKIKKNKTNQLINEARSLFYQNFIEDNNSNQQNLFTAAKKLINQGDKRTVFPPFVDKRRFADQMGNYFVEKIQDIQTKLNNMVQGLQISLLIMLLKQSLLYTISPHLRKKKVLKLVKGCKKKGCNLDPMPTPLVIDCIDVLLPLITKIINLSLESGTFPFQAL
jgi:hypothetical protein